MTKFLVTADLSYRYVEAETKGQAFAEAMKMASELADKLGDFEVVGVQVYRTKLDEKGQEVRDYED